MPSTWAPTPAADQALSARGVQPAVRGGWPGAAAAAPTQPPSRGHLSPCTTRAILKAELRRASPSAWCSQRGDPTTPGAPWPRHSKSSTSQRWSSLTARSAGPLRRSSAPKAWMTHLAGADAGACLLGSGVHAQRLYNARCQAQSGVWRRTAIRCAQCAPALAVVCALVSTGSVNSSAAAQQPQARAWAGAQPWAWSCAQG